MFVPVWNVVRISGNVFRNSGSVGGSEDGVGTAAVVSVSIVGSAVAADDTTRHSHPRSSQVYLFISVSHLSHLTLNMTLNI